MDQKSKKQNWDYGTFVTAGVVLTAVSVDLAGRLLHFLYGEWPYICAGLVVLVFLGVSVHVRSQFSQMHETFQRDLMQQIESFRDKVASIQSDNRRLHGEIGFMQKSIQEYWVRCGETIKKVEKLMEEKTPVVVTTSPVQVEPLDSQVDQAIQEVVGGAT